MNDIHVVNVHTEVIEDGSIFMWGTRVNQRIWEAEDLKHILFAWHATSFYGTFIETTVWNGLDGIVLNPLDALHFFHDPNTIQHFDIEWSSSSKNLVTLAPAILHALQQGQVMPDYLQWKQGRWNWKLQLPDDIEAMQTPQIMPWVQSLISHWLQTNPTMKQELHRIETLFPHQEHHLRSQANWLDEEDWLVAIGWKPDTHPIRTCLQLHEPKELTTWQLSIVLQDRINPELMRKVTPQGDPLTEEAAFPEHWLNVADLVSRDIQKWSTLVSSLFTTNPLKEHSVLSTSLMVDDEALYLRTALDDIEAWKFLSEESVCLLEAGYQVLLPAWWKRIRKSRPRLRAKIKSTANIIPQVGFGLQHLLEFDWKLAIGDIELTEDEFRQLLSQRNKIIQIRGEWIQLDAKLITQIEQVLKKVSRKKGLTFRDVLELHLTETGLSSSFSPDNDAMPEIQMEVELNQHLQHMIQQLLQHRDLPVVDAPASFHGSLRTYQKEGVSWLFFLRQFGLGGCLADDMGLGKTIQWITYLLILKEHQLCETPSLLICPTSVLGNWQKELKRFAPSLRIYMHYGPMRWKNEEFTQQVLQYDVILTTFTLSHIDRAELKSIQWNCICLDEAQNIKNAYTKQSTTIRGLKALHRIALTGTPIENRLSELWSIYDFINPGYFGTLRDFSAKYISMIEKNRESDSISKLQKMIRPFLLRRMKKDPAVQLDLPEKNESNLYVSLTVEQVSLYEQITQHMFEQVNGLTRMERRGMILNTLTKLKQLCNHPALALKEGSYTKWQNRSNKLHRLLEMVQELRQEGDKCLIFTQYVETGHMLKAVLESELQENILFLHGGISKPQRDEMIADFQGELSASTNEHSIFILSLKAGGVGLNLTAANHVFHYDRWWNPAVEQQATDRAYRIGQIRNVQVYKFVTLGTLEERIDEMIMMKQGLSEQIVAGSEQWITELTDEELLDIFHLRSEIL